MHNIAICGSLRGWNPLLAAIGRRLYRSKIYGSRDAALGALFLACDHRCTDFASGDASPRKAVAAALMNRWVEPLVIGGLGLAITQGLLFIGLKYTGAINGVLPPGLLASGRPVRSVLR